MEITGTNILWKDYDVNALPFNETTLSSKTVDGVKIDEYYFDGFATVGGRVRAYIKIYENPDAKAIILYLPDTSDGDVWRDVKCYYEKGYSIAVLDYAGESSTSPRFTIYPKSLAHCNCRDMQSFEASDDALSSNWFVWTCTARKAIRFLQKKYADKKVFGLGKKIGGSIMYKLCAFDDGLCAAATLLGILPEVTGTGNKIINYRAALDNTAYASITKVPLLIIVASNDADRSFDDMSDLAYSTASLKCFRILKRAFAEGIHRAIPQTVAYFDAYLVSEPQIPKITISAKNSENKLYFNIKIIADETTPVSDLEVSLLAAFRIDNPSHRNWTNLPVIKIGAGEYIGHADILENQNNVYAFVNVVDQNANVTSSKLLTILPKSLGITSQTAIRKRLIYNGGMGKDVWTTTAVGDVYVEEGPLEIAGITSDSNELVTFKPGDLLYGAERNDLLQIILCAKDEVKAELFDDEDTYTYIIEKLSDGWQKITMSVSDFKGANPLVDWSKIVMLRLTSKDKFIVSSVLWV